MLDFILFASLFYLNRRLIPPYHIFIKMGFSDVISFVSVVYVGFGNSMKDDAIQITFSKQLRFR